MKKQYLSPEMTVEQLKMTDIVTTSITTTSIVTHEETKIDFSEWAQPSAQNDGE